MKEETLIISLGGSLIVPEDVDADFLREFKSLIELQVKQGKKFIIITGGGKICRKYQSAAQKVKEMNSAELDWLGIYSTRFNAELIKLLFGGLAEGKIVLDPTLPIKSNKPIIVGGGWKPGWSTDYVATILGKQLGARKIINLSNTDYVYDSDPRENLNAKKIEEISWVKYRTLIPKEWTFGLNTPFDPIASKMAEEEGMEVIIMNGKNITNLEKCLNKEEFIGTTIK